MKDLRGEYVSRINRVLDYIEAHLDKELTLEELASVASFSRFHFHRIFGAIMGETLNQFIQRVRIQKAATLLLSNPGKSITEVAFDCGFSGSAPFARAFKEAFQMSASQWRTGGYSEYRKSRKTNSNNDQHIHKIRKDFQVSSMYIDSETRNPNWRIQMMYKPTMQVHVEVKDIPEKHVAYVRHVGPYKGDSKLFEGLYERLCRWAGPRGLIRPGESEMMSVYHDNPEITDEEKLRISVCLTVPEDTEVGGEIGKMILPGGKCAVARFELNGDQFQDAWTAVFAGWLPDSGYQPDDRPSYELCHNDPKDHPEGKFVVDIVVPVKPL